jgi:acetyl esterase/lipase
MIVTRTWWSLVVLGCLAGSSSPAYGQRVRLPENVELVPNVEYGKAGQQSLKLDLLRPKAQPQVAMPVVVYIHGGRWQTGDKSKGIPLLARLVERGYLGASINYRLSGEAVFPAQIEDCRCAIRFLRSRAKQYHIDPDRIGVWGESAGGHLAALLGTAGGLKEFDGSGGAAELSSRVQAVCAWFAPSDLPSQARWSGMADQAIAKLLGGTVADHPEKAAKASPITHVSADDPPFLLMHGDQDALVPPVQSEKLHAALTKAGVKSTLHIVKGAGHRLFTGAEVETIVDDFFDQHLLRGKPR